MTVGAKVCLIVWTALLCWASVICLGWMVWELFSYAT